jgi:hypothetical protein
VPELVTLYPFPSGMMVDNQQFRAVRDENSSVRESPRNDVLNASGQDEGGGLYLNGTRNVEHGKWDGPTTSYD